MTIVDGTFVEDTADDILDALIEDARDEFGEDLNDGEFSVIRAFYTPVAERLAEAQQDIGLVLSSAQIDNADGRALDLLTALIGVRRRSGRRATGEVIFSRENAASTDYTIPRGTTVQTDHRFDPVRFETTQSVTLEEGDTEIAVPVESKNPGVDGILGSNTLVVMPTPPSGIEAVTNPDPTEGGAERETDDELRERAKHELAEGAKATAAALVSGTSSLDGVTNVSIFTNDTSVDNTGSGGLPAHSFELVVEGGDDEDIGQLILETKAAGDTAYAGAYGSPVTTDATLSNGQTFSVEFSRHIPVQIYISANISVTDEYEGDDAVRDEITRYVGGILSTGNAASGQLGVGEEVVIGEIKYAIRNIRGVYDIDNLEVDTSQPPSGSSNISIDDNERATTDATDGSIEIDTTEV